jgi:chromosomal replication initiation ATPase DnaA
VALEGDVARIAVDNRYTEDWLSHRLNETIEETLGRALGRAVRAEFFVPEAE